MNQLPRYRCHKVVEAAKIINLSTLGHWMLEGGTVIETSEALRKRAPGGGLGGYYVRYEDGYESWSPAQAFEEGYHLEPTETGDPGTSAYLAFERAATQAFEARWPKDDKHKLIRDLCIKIAEKKNYDAHRLVITPPTPEPYQGPEGSWFMHGTWHPLWAAYYQPVRLVLDQMP